MTTRRHLLALAFLGACLVWSRDGGRAEARTVKVVATFSILGDLVRNVDGGRVEVATLVSADGDAHVCSPTPADARRVADAAVVVANGLTFDGWIDCLATSSGGKAREVEAAKGVKPIKGGHDRGRDRGHSHAGDVDPHAWQNVANVKLYVSAIRDALVGADPAGRGVYEENAAAYGAKLDALDRGIKAAVETIPADRRKVITSHDAFLHFEATYGMAFVAPPGRIDGSGSLGEGRRQDRAADQARADVGRVPGERFRRAPHRSDRPGDRRRRRRAALLGRAVRAGRPGGHLHQDDAPQRPDVVRGSGELKGRWPRVRVTAVAAHCAIDGGRRRS
jgi:zinc/manganese transport system substrate-binding protein